uniref:Uncharacterized protein n=1 Tax=Romanomermis culicivorax TaxID=13658 RepID=A0A915HFX6_ROMCU
APARALQNAKKQKLRKATNCGDLASQLFDEFISKLDIPLGPGSTVSTGSSSSVFMPLRTYT